MGDAIYKIIESLYNQQAALAQGYASQIEPYVRSAAGVGSLIYIFSSVIIQIYNNQDINFFPLLRPFVIMMMIPFAPKFSSAIDNFGGSITQKINGENINIATRVQKTNEQIQHKIDQKWATIGADPEKYKALFGGDLNAERDAYLGMGSIGVDIKLGFARISEDLKFQIMTVIQEIFLAVMYLAESCLLIISIGYRVVLRIGFPIALALSIFPGFTSNLANWFGRYLNAALLPAVAAMYSTLAFNLIDKYINNYSVDNAMSTMGIETAQPDFLGVAFVGMLIIILIGYTQVPSMTAMLISVGGMGGIIQGATQRLMTMGSMANNRANKISQKMGKAVSSYQEALRPSNVSKNLKR